MIYALNLFNLIPGKEGVYREYSIKAGKLIYRLRGQVICSGHKPVRYLKTDGVKRNRFIVVKFPDEDVFNKFYSPEEYKDIHRLREDSTCDYIWILFKNWDLLEWVNENTD